ncbi:hypothetical protein SDC9_197880 [bioreactor metagenome]|uniref:Uncharacterized protein n=1 Tax=bioreactor metagenome TaxID=1076179 RepID=A0A645IPI4_9ZZZZ
MGHERGLEKVAEGLDRQEKDGGEKQSQMFFDFG